MLEVIAVVCLFSLLYNISLITSIPEFTYLVSCWWMFEFFPFLSFFLFLFFAVLSHAIRKILTSSGAYT